MLPPIWWWKKVPAVLHSCGARKYMCPSILSTSFSITDGHWLDQLIILGLSEYGSKLAHNSPGAGVRFSPNWNGFTYLMYKIHAIYGFCICSSLMQSMMTVIISRKSGTVIQCGALTLTTEVPVYVVFKLPFLISLIHYRIFTSLDRQNWVSMLMIMRICTQTSWMSFTA